MSRLNGKFGEFEMTLPEFVVFYFHGSKVPFVCRLTNADEKTEIAAIVQYFGEMPHIWDFSIFHKSDEEMSRQDFRLQVDDTIKEWLDGEEFKKKDASTDKVDEDRHDDEYVSIYQLIGNDFDKLSEIYLLYTGDKVIVAVRKPWFPPEEEETSEDREWE